MNRRFYLLFVVLALVTWGIITIFSHDFKRGPKLGTFAPEFSLNNFQGESLSFSQFQGRVVLLNFWATWCGPCRQEMPSLETLYQKYKDQGFVVLGVSLDEEGWTAIQSFLKNTPVSFPNVLDAKQKVAELYEIYRIPETYLIDKEGRIAGKYVGPQDFTREVFSDKIQRLLKKK